MQAAKEEREKRNLAVAMEELEEIEEEDEGSE